MIGPTLGTVDRADHFRAEVQGLRAVAVLAVLAFHLWPNRVTGGFVGVDVFFVISGYLITAHLVRELEVTGSIRLARFWARRLRRLLPAALLVLAASAVATAVWLPATVWARTARQLAASTVYVQNWALAAESVDYLAATSTPTVAQHYWSLSVEEQFYLLWPVLLLGFAVLARRRLGATRRALVVGIAAVGLGSLATSVWLTGADPALAYFVTPTRVWELAAGAMLAVLGPPQLAARARAVLGWLGLAAIAVATVRFSPATPFPGVAAAAPVLGSAAVIAGTGSQSRLDLAPLLAWRPARFIGDVSYSLYLWHWPLVVLWPWVTGVALRTGDKAAIAVLAVLLAWVTKVLVEDPGRSARLLATPVRAFALSAAGMTVVLLATGGLQLALDRRLAESGHAPEAGTACSGPAALERGCVPVVGTGELVPSPEAAAAQNDVPAYPGCQQTGRGTEALSCVLGDRDGERVLAVVGDSHATQWFPAWDDLGAADGWQVRTYTKSSCPLTSAIRTSVLEETAAEQQSCLTWLAEVRQVLLDPEIDVVAVAAYSSAYGYLAPSGRPMADPAVEGYREAWADLVEAGKRVLVLADVPRTKGADVPTCLAAHPDDRLACAVPRDEALPSVPTALAAARMAGVERVDLTDRFCDARWCYPVVGDLVVYRDYSHLTTQYARALVPDLRAALNREAED